MSTAPHSTCPRRARRRDEYQLHESRVRHREQQSEVLFSHSGKYSRAWRDLRLVADCGLKIYEPIVQPLLDDCERPVTLRCSCLRDNHRYWSAEGRPLIDTGSSTRVVIRERKNRKLSGGAVILTEQIRSGEWMANSPFTLGNLYEPLSYYQRLRSDKNG